jgi:hypothetical protein
VDEPLVGPSGLEQVLPWLDPGAHRHALPY